MLLPPDRPARDRPASSLEHDCSASTADWIELDDSFSQAIDPETGLMTIAGGQRAPLPGAGAAMGVALEAERTSSTRKLLLTSLRT